MGAGASLQEDVPTGWHALAAMAEAADKPDLVAKIVRENQIDAATALKLDDDDLRELVDRKLDFKKLQGCLLYTSPSPRDKRQSRMPSSA